MDRDELISQVKDEYARLADISSKESFIDLSDTNKMGEAYYEKVLQNVINAILAGQFDGFGSGKEIVEAVANNKHDWL